MDESFSHSVLLRGSNIEKQNTDIVAKKHVRLAK